MRCALARAVVLTALTVLVTAGCHDRPAVARVYVYSIQLPAHPTQLGTPAEQSCLHSPGVPSGEAILGTGSGPGSSATQFVLAVRGNRTWGNSVAACLDALPGHDVRFSNVVRDDEGLFPPTH